MTSYNIFHSFNSNFNLLSAVGLDECKKFLHFKHEISMENVQRCPNQYFYVIFIKSTSWKSFKTTCRVLINCAPNARSWVIFQNINMYYFCCFITRLVKKLQKWSLHEVIEDTLPCIFNPNRPLRDIWLLRYKQNC